MAEEDRVLEERKEKVINFFKKDNVWVIGLLIVALILGAYVRSLPMQVRSDTGKPGLWDITTNTWTLGPDLDPWLFTRQAKTIVETGSLPKRDYFRYVPLGFENAKETELLPKMISWTYYLVNIFGNYNLNFAAVIFPVFMFVLTIISFFLFVREIFVKEENTRKANIISLIATFLMIVTPVFLSRTIAGIPEKESAGFFFMFLSFYLFLKAWKSGSIKNAVILGILSGISTALMGLIWGGVVYIFVSVAVASFIAFILNRVSKKEFIVYTLWIAVSWFVMLFFSERFTFSRLAASVDTGLAFIVFGILLVHFVLWETRISKFRILKQSKMPKNILSLIVAFVLGIIGISILFGPGFIIEKIKDINQLLFKPVTGRWNVTVAENRQPYFTEWARSFGPFIKNVPVMFWLFFIGSVVLFKKMFKTLKEKDSWILTGLYVFFFFGLVFSRYAPHPAVFDGEGIISKLFYFGSALLLVGGLIYFYAKYHKEGNSGFEKISFEYLFLIALFILTLFTARSAVRLIMVLGPVAPIFVGFLIVEVASKFLKTKEETMKVILGALIIILLILGIFTFNSYYKSTTSQARGFVPSYYNQQWQKAMAWVRNDTPQNAVFAHWWDYGYWLQSIGDRATVLDGGNSIVYWNYLMGRLVLTGDNQKDSLEFLYNHNATHLLIDSSDIGKYGAFSSIGSNEDSDRYSWIPTMLSDPKQMTETATGTTRVYAGGVATDEDIIYNLNGTQIFLPGQKAAVGGVLVETVQENESVTFKRPIVVYFYNNQQVRIPLRYLEFNGEFFDFGSGLEGGVKIIQKIDSSNQGIKVDSLGALIYISPRVMRGYLAQKYLLDDPFNKFPNFELEYTEPNLIIDSLNSQGANLNEFVYYQGLQGPIKIWSINYTGNETVNQEYLDTDYTKYISWKL